jgi:two-component system nitrogen regulation sensor histidine kinase GlnL
LGAGPDAVRQLASLPLAVVLLEPGLRIAGVNPAAEQFFGQSLRRLSGRRITDLLRFDDARMAERIGDAETPVSARQIGVQLKDRGLRRIDMAASPVTDAPGWQLLTLNDNSASEALGGDPGAAGDVVLRAPEILAHEIKNPLAGIRGAAQLLARTAGEGERALTDLITDEVDRIAKLIDEMQTLSRRTNLPVAPCNLHESARRAIAVLDAADAGGTQAAARIEEEFDPSLPPVLGNADALVQVLINLLSNAREACRTARHRQVVLRTRFASGLQLHSTGEGKPVRLPVEVRVTDNGPGVAPAMREHIFEPFVTTKKTGQGLGLPLVRKLVREMNGRITHERDDTRGLTHFRVHLPLADELAGRVMRAPARRKV